MFVEVIAVIGLFVGGIAFTTFMDWFTWTMDDYY